MLNRLGNILEKHKYFFAIFVFFVVYNFVIVGNFSFPSIDHLCYLFHIVDYSIGFCPTLLPGALYNAIFSTTQVDAVNLYVNIIYHLFLLAVSFMLEKFLYKFDSKNRFFAFIIVLFFITGPSTFSIHAAEIGMLDMYWLFLAAILLIIVQNKYFKWFVPIIFVLSIFIHYGAAISFIPFFALIVLLEASKNKKLNKSYLFIFAVSILLSATVFIYFTVFEERNLYLSLDSFRAFMNERNFSEWGDWLNYYEYSLYRVIPDSYDFQMENFVFEGKSNFLIQAFGAVLRQIKLIFNLFSEIDGEYLVNFVRDVLVSMPIIAFLYKIVLSFFKKDKENKLRRFIWICALCLLPFTFLTSILSSTDFIKWFGHGVICLFTLVMYELYRSSDVDCFESLNKRIKPSSNFVVIIYFVCYMMCTMNPLT